MTSIGVPRRAAVPGAGDSVATEPEVRSEAVVVWLDGIGEGSVWPVGRSKVSLRDASGSMSSKKSRPSGSSLGGGIGAMVGDPGVADETEGEAEAGPEAGAGRGALEARIRAGVERRE